MSETILSVRDAARRLGVKAARISKLFYDDELNNDLCPILSGRRLIPESYVEVIAMVLRRKGVEVSQEVGRG